MQVTNYRNDFQRDQGSELEEQAFRDHYEQVTGSRLWKLIDQQVFDYAEVTRNGYVKRLIELKTSINPNNYLNDGMTNRVWVPVGLKKYMTGVSYVKNGGMDILWVHRWRDRPNGEYWCIDFGTLVELRDTVKYPARVTPRSKGLFLEVPLEMFTRLHDYQDIGCVETAPII